MGPCPSHFHGDIDAELTAIINDCPEHKFQSVLEVLDSNAQIDKYVINTKFALI